MSSDRNQLGPAEWAVTRRDVLRGALAGTTIVVDGGADAWGIGEPPPPVEAPA